jgi:AraC-like DNA-binding protein
MRYAEYPPSPRLRSLVERFWLLEGLATGGADAIIPDGRVELIFHYGGSFWRHTDAAEPVEQPGSLLVGQMVEPVRLAPSGQAGVAAIRLRPSASRTLLRFPLAEVSGRFVDLELMFPSVATLRERLAEASHDGERLAALEQWLVDAACPPPRPQVDTAVGLIVQSGGRVSIDSLTRQTGLSVRQIERQFQEDVGLSPKVFSRIIRLQVALRRVRQGIPLMDVALASGYYDQAHMTRDFRQIAAMSPGVWQVHAGELAPLFVEAGVRDPTPSSPASAPACA